MGRAKKWSLCASLVQKGTTYANVCRTEMMSHSLRESLNTHRPSAARDRDGGWDKLASHSTPSHAGLAKTGDDVGTRTWVDPRRCREHSRACAACRAATVRAAFGWQRPTARVERNRRWMCGRSKLERAAVRVQRERRTISGLQNWIQIPSVKSTKTERYLDFSKKKVKWSDPCFRPTLENFGSKFLRSS